MYIRFQCESSWHPTVHIKWNRDNSFFVPRKKRIHCTQWIIIIILMQCVQKRKLKNISNKNMPNQTCYVTERIEQPRKHTAMRAKTKVIRVAINWWVHRIMWRAQLHCSSTIQHSTLHRKLADNIFSFNFFSHLIHTDFQFHPRCSNRFPFEKQDEHWNIMKKFLIAWDMKHTHNTHREFSSLWIGVPFEYIKSTRNYSIIALFPCIACTKCMLIYVVLN